MSYRDTFGGRLYDARKNKKITQSALAKRLHVSKQAVSNWENNKNHPDTDKLADICSILERESSWLLTGQGELTNNEYSIRAGEVIIYKLKEISEYPIVKDHSLARQTTIAYFDASDSSFAIYIEDSSMHPEFIEGDVVIIDPEVSPLPGDRVCALVEGYGDAVFRSYKSSGIKDPSNVQANIFTLLPLNKNWAPIDVNGNGKIIGVMVEHKKPRRTA